MVRGRKGPARVPGTKVSGNERSRERMVLGGKARKGLQCFISGTKVPGNERSRERIFQRTNSLGNEYSSIQFCNLFLKASAYGMLNLSLLHCALSCAVYCNRPCLSVCLWVRLATASAQCLRHLWALLHHYNNDDEKALRGDANTARWLSPLSCHFIEVAIVFVVDAGAPRT